MSIYHEGTAPPLRDDGLPHEVVQFSDGTWACNFGCPSCRAAGFYLHGGPTKPKQRRGRRA